MIRAVTINPSSGQIQQSTLNFTGVTVTGGPVLYTSQALSSAQAGQVFQNLAPTNGAITATGIKWQRGNNNGIRWVTSNDATVGAIYFSQDHGGAGIGETIMEGHKSAAIVAADPSVNGFAIQLGTSGGTAGTDVAYIPRQGGAGGGTPLIHSQFFLLGAEYWNGVAPVTTGVTLRTLALDTSGNVALEVAAESLGGDVTNAAQLRVPNGATAFPGLSVRNSGMGMWSPSSTQLRFQVADGEYVDVGQGGTFGLPGGGFITTGYDGTTTFGSAAALGVRLYYPRLGFGTNGATEGYASADNGSGTAVKVFTWHGTDGLRVDAGEMLIAAAAKGVRYGVAGPIDTYGSGSPEGAVATPVGSTFRRTDGGGGTAFYVKESGTGNTGWVGK